ncbi:MAG: tetratricopeptide repeat protein [Kofleriaceae bacterium]
MIKQRSVASVLCAAALSAVTGCFWVTTKSEGEQLRTKVDSIDQRLSSKEQSLDEKIAQLQKVLDESAKLLKRNSADLGAEFEQLAQKVNTANGLVVAINNTISELKTSYENYRKQNDTRLDGIEQRVAQIESGKPSASSSPEELWKLGVTAFEAQRYTDAIEIFRRLVQSFPTHDRADDAQYFRGQSYTNLKDWNNAIASYQALVDKYRDSQFADDGLYFAALAAQQLKNCTEARAYLGVIAQKYKKSNVVRQASALDKAIKKDAKNKSKCSS